MPAPNCPFQTPIITGEFACSLALPVTVRNTPRIHCQAEGALAVCTAVHESMKRAGLAEFGLEDDLSSTPHSVYLKIQTGGLLGLQASLAQGDSPAGRIADVHALIDRITEGGKCTDRIDYAALVPAMRSQTPRRRRDRKR